MFLSKIEVKEDIWFDQNRKPNKMFKTSSKTVWEDDRMKPINSSVRSFGRRAPNRYEKKKVVYKYFRIFEKGLSIDFENNLTVIVGDNGCGKTTLFKYLELPKIHFYSFDKDVVKKAYKEWLDGDEVKLTFVKQPEFLFVNKQIHKNSFIETVKKSKITLDPQDVLSLWDMQSYSNGENTLDFLESLSKDLSNGLIVLDEPETSLSIKSQYKAFKLIQKIAKENQVIVITHSPILMGLSNEVYDFESKKYTEVNKYINQQMINK